MILMLIVALVGACALLYLVLYRRILFSSVFSPIAHIPTVQGKRAVFSRGDWRMHPA